MQPRAATRGELRAGPAHPGPWTRNFRLLWAGHLLGEMGSVSASMAALIWTSQATGSSLMLGVVLTCFSLPAALLAPLGGALADRLDRRSILVVCDGLSGITMLALAALFVVSTSTPERLSAVAAATLVLGIIAGAFRPAVAACIPDTVPGAQLDAANGWYGSSAAFARITGYATAGAASAVVGPALLYAASGVTFFLSGLLTRRMALRPPVPTSSGPAAAWRQSLREMLEHLRGERGLQRLLIGGCGLNFLLSSVSVLLPLFVERTLGVSAAWYGYLLSGLALGTALGFIGAGALCQALGSRRAAFALGSSLEAALLIALGLTRSALLALLILVALGVTLGVLNVVVQTTLQLAVPAALRGRILGLLITLINAVMPASFLLAGLIGELSAADVGRVFCIAGLGMSVIVAWLLSGSELAALLAISAPIGDRSDDAPV